MRKINSLLNEYGQSHQHATNKLIHWICVPLIFFSIVGLIASIPSQPLHSLLGNQSPFIHWATLLLIMLLIYYFRLSFTLTIGMALFSIGCLLGVVWISSISSLPLWQVSLIIFVLAWIGQFYGHKIEGKKPSFFKDLQFLLIGPAWLMHFIYKKLGIPY